MIQVGSFYTHFGAENVSNLQKKKRGQSLQGADIYCSSGVRKANRCALDLKESGFGICWAVRRTVSH